MSARNAKRSRRRAADPSRWQSRGLKAGGLLATIHDVPDTCPVCGGAHHEQLYPPEGTKAAPALRDAYVQDHLWHATVAAWAVLKDHGVPQDRWLEVLEPVATAMATCAAAGEHFGRRHAIELFWQGLIEEQGFGTYVFELSPNGIVSSRPS